MNNNTRKRNREARKEHPHRFKSQPRVSKFAKVGGAARFRDKKEVLL